MHSIQGCLASFNSFSIHEHGLVGIECKLVVCLQVCSSLFHFNDWMALLELAMGRSGLSHASCGSFPIPHLHHKVA
jgi:hypothetical protein